MMAGGPGSDAGRNRDRLRGVFIASWAGLLCAKLWLAWRLPVFVDEAFYAWESRRLAWAYSDLPGLSAWLAHAGLLVGGESAFALRLPFLLLGAALPWLVVRIAARWFGARAGWSAGLLSLLMPLSALLGVMAMPDVPLVLASLLCLDAIASLRERVHAAAWMELAIALAMGALAHYRFAMVILAGLLGMLLDPRARRLLREPALWGVLAFGALAWWPLLQWNLAHAGAGLRFHLVERNPWSFHADGAAWLPIQFLLVTPALFVLLIAVARHAWRQRQDESAGWGLLAAIAILCVAGWFVLGFFADSERVSFHWPLAGWLALLCAAPVLLERWSRGARALVWVGGTLGTLLAVCFLLSASLPGARKALAWTSLYPNDFAGWQEASAWLRSEVAPHDANVASDFELGAQLAFALGRDDVQVLDDPLNVKHGRAAQLQLWGLQLDRAPRRAAWFVLDDAATRPRLRLASYHRQCALLGALPPPRVLSVDHGQKRYLLFRFDPAAMRAGCVAPALAYIDAPAPRQAVPAQFDVEGWAFKDGAGIARVEVLLDGRSMGDARYGDAKPGVAQFWRISTDAAHPRVGFRAQVDASSLPAGKHWLGLRLHGRDGSVEDWPEQEVRLQPR
jgi:4-amino-4-deoxy-L-arabinose transferase-like glycosyltransferase